MWGTLWAEAQPERSRATAVSPRGTAAIGTAVCVGTGCVCRDRRALTMFYTTNRRVQNAGIYAYRYIIHIGAAA